MAARGEREEEAEEEEGGKEGVDMELNGGEDRVIGTREGVRVRWCVGESEGD